MESIGCVSQSLYGPSTPSQGSNLNRVGHSVQHSSSSKEKAMLPLGRKHRSHEQKRVGKTTSCVAEKQQDRRGASPGSPVQNVEPIMHPAHPKGSPQCMVSIAKDSEQISRQIIKMSASQAERYGSLAHKGKYLAGNYTMLTSDDTDEDEDYEGLVGTMFPLTNTAVARAALEGVLREDSMEDKVVWLQEVTLKLCEEQARLGEQLKKYKHILKEDSNSEMQNGSRFIKQKYLPPMKRLDFQRKN